MSCFFKNRSSNQNAILIAYTSSSRWDTMPWQAVKTELFSLIDDEALKTKLEDQLIKLEHHAAKEINNALEEKNRLGRALAKQLLQVYKQAEIKEAQAIQAMTNGIHQQCNAQLAIIKRHRSLTEKNTEQSLALLYKGVNEAIESNKLSIHQHIKTAIVKTETEYKNSIHNLEKHFAQTINEYQGKIEKHCKKIAIELLTDLYHQFISQERIKTYWQNTYSR